MEPNKNQTESPFSSQTNADQTNPFTGDLKGEFTSEFGTNTNAVSQIFNNSGFASQGRTKIIIAVVAALSLLGGGLFYLQSQDSDITDESLLTEEDALEEGEALEDGDAKESTGEASKENTGLGEESAEASESSSVDKLTEDSQLSDEASSASTSTDIASTESSSQVAKSNSSTDFSASSATNAMTGTMSVISPIAGAETDYDETMGPAEFIWEGNANRIMFSRSSNMGSIYRFADVTNKNNYKFNGIYPGTWYWQLQGPDGMSDIKQFNVSAPARRDFSIIEPQSGQAINSNGGSISWSGAEKVARYQVQFKGTDTSWANPIYKYGTAGTRISVSGITPGLYDMRVGAFSEVSGRWEWQIIKGVSVQ